MRKKKWQRDVRKEESTSSSATEKEPTSIVAFTEDELEAFKENMASQNTTKSTTTAVRRLQSWYLAKYKTELNLNNISKAEAPQLLNRQGDEGSSRKGARKYNNKIWKTNGGERDPYRAFIEYVGHSPQGEKVPENFFLTPVANPTTNIWYKAVPVGKNNLAKMMQKIASNASLEGKFANSSGRKTVIQSLREEFNPLEISELTGHADPNSISSYSHNPAEKQRRMSNKLAGFTPSATATTTANDAGNASSTSSVVNREASALPPAVHGRVQEEGIYSRSPMKALSGLFTGVTFTNSPVNISINFQSNVNPRGEKNSSLH